MFREMFRDRDVVGANGVGGRPAYLGRRAPEEDARRYLAGYPDLTRVFPDLRANEKFYRNQIPCQPDGDLIDNVHERWSQGDVPLLDKLVGFANWLFPIREVDRNSSSDPLQMCEIEALRAEPAAVERVLRSYELFMKMHGIDLDRTTGQLSTTNPQLAETICFESGPCPVVRVLKSIGEFGFEHFQIQFCRFCAEHLSANPTVLSCLVSEWIHFCRTDEDTRVGLLQLCGGPGDVAVTTEREAKRYRDGYPDLNRVFPNLRANQLFYLNLMRSRPDGDLIDNIHTEWRGKFGLLEEHHGYIQWLFPIREVGMNSESDPLQLCEVETLLKPENIVATRNRLIASYELMLDFYGMRLVDRASGQLARATHRKQRSCYENLNYSSHNYLRITRILKCLGEFGLDFLQVPFCEFCIDECFVKRALPNIAQSLMRFWIPVCQNERERRRLLDLCRQSSSCCHAS